MTIAIGLQTLEGVVLGADSTTTVTVHANPSTIPPGAIAPPQQPQVAQLFNSAQKLFEIGPRNERFTPGRNFSGGFVTWGDGSFGPLSWRDLVNRFYVSERETLRSTDNVTQRFAEFSQRTWSELQHSGSVQSGTAMPAAGGMIGAISRGALSVEGGIVDFRNGTHSHLQRGNAQLGGMGETANRIIVGHDPSLKEHLVNAGVDASIFDACAARVGVTAFTEHMPLRDAIDFVHFLLYATIKLHRYKGGPAMVGGAIEIAAITADRGFRWIMHKPLRESIGLPADHHFA